MARAPRDGSSQARLTLTDARVLLLFGVCYRCVAIRRRVLRVAIDGVKTGSGVASATEQLVHSKSVAKKLQKIEKTLNIGERSSFKRELKGLGGALRKAMRSVGEHTPTGANKGAVVSPARPNSRRAVVRSHRVLACALRGPLPAYGGRRLCA